MNEWIEKSIRLASSRGYLDGLSNVYPIGLELERNIKEEEKKKIKKALARKNSKELITALLNLERFPIDDPYIGFLRKDREAINKNPKTVKRIGEKLLRMGFDNLILGAGRAKTPSRQIGQLFRKYLHMLGYPVLPRDEFLKNKKVAILDGGDSALMNFAKEELGYKGKKGLDLVLKINGKFIIGEAKFISMGGGTQDKSFREGISFIKHKSKRAIHIAIFDGVVWLIKKSNKPSLYGTIFNLENNQIIVSTLLLRDFIESFRKKK
jgi:hypothetical protein